MQRRHLFLGAACAASVGIITACSSTATQPKASAATSAPKPATVAAPVASTAPGLHMDWLDKSVDPGNDFFHYANGGWQKQNPIPAAYSRWGTFNVLIKQNEEAVHDILEQTSKQDNKPGSIEQKVGDFYATGMDEAGIEAAGIKPLQPELKAIAAIKNRTALQKEMAHLQMMGVDAMFGFGEMQDFKDSSKIIGAAFQGGLGLPDRDYYLKTADKCPVPAASTAMTPPPASTMQSPAQAAFDACKAQAAQFQKVRDAYVAHVAAMLQLAGDPSATAAKEAKTIMAMETRLAQAAMSRVQMRTPTNIYHPTTVKALRKTTPDIYWGKYFAVVGHPEIKGFNLATPDFFKTLDRELARDPLADWKAYLRWHLVDAAAPYLSKAFVDEDFKMRSALTGAKELLPRWQRVVSTEDDLMGFATGKLYVEKKFPPSSKQAVVDILHDIRGALKDDLTTLSWMSPDTRKAAVAKLEAIQERIGYPDKWRDYSALDIKRDSYVMNVMRASEFEQKRELNKIGKPLDTNDWEMTPQEVNAYYSPQRNNINFPAGILQPPFFDPKAPAAVNYGALGFVMGHEITHGFDDQGAQFDAKGNLLPGSGWWTPEDFKKFHAATDCISDHFSGYTVADGTHVQGHLVTGEATADLGGLTLAYRAFHASQAYKDAKTIDGMTPDQQFFLGAAHVWAESVRPEEQIRRVTIDPHPPGLYRVNGTLANMPAFQQAFGIKDGSPMVNKDRCVIW
ncbi:MAG TPA: M13 family metallopeptidase [Gammaproteobacteria bacterium]|nr:M13 family metallopeptidase [Gammaproteobacteria bacterium]